MKFDGLKAGWWLPPLVHLPSCSVYFDWISAPPPASLTNAEQTLKLLELIWCISGPMSLAGTYLPLAWADFLSRSAWEASRWLFILLASTVGGALFSFYAFYPVAAAALKPPNYIDPFGMIGLILFQCPVTLATSLLEWHYFSKYFVKYYSPSAKQVAS